MPDQVKITEQVSFAGALNAVASPHNLAENEVQASTNVDYSLQWGALSPRRGCQVLLHTPQVGTNVASQQISGIFRNYGLSTGTWTDSVITWLGASQNGFSYQGVFLGAGSGAGNLQIGPGTTTYTGGASTQIVPCFSQYNGYAYVANGTSAFRIGGSSGVVYDWLLPQADTPVVTFSPQFNVSIPFVGFAGTGGGTYSAIEGTITASSTLGTFGVSTILTTCTTGTGSRIVLIGTCSTTNWENPNIFVTTPTGTTVTGPVGNTYTLGGYIDFHQGYPGGDTTGTYTGTATVTQTITTGAYGTDYIMMSLPNQQTVVTIQRDLSIGDTSFSNYWHQETTASAINDATVDPVTAMLESLGNTPAFTQNDAVNANRGFLPHVGGASLLPPIRKTIAKTAVAGNSQASPWAVSRSDYQFIGAAASPDFTSIQAVRLIIEFSTTGQQATLGGVLTYGGLGYPLNDQVSGISYYQTFARVENGFIVAEGAPSKPSTPTKTQFAHAQLTCVASTNTTAGITHRVFYRSGGLLQDGYRVGSVSILSGTNTIYDYALPDMGIINNPLITRNLWSTWPSPTAGTGLPGVNALSLPWQNRIFVGVQNQLYWSVPGVPNQIQDSSQTTVADIGDSIQGIVPAQNLIIVNQASVFELAGSIFEGNSQNWTLTRSLSRRGSAAPRTVCTSPYGILLFGYDGLSLYRPGFGQDQDLPWVYEKIGDLWKGGGANDPATVKGRIPALNQSCIFNACAAYQDEKFYLAVPTGTNTLADTVFVLDVPHQKTWMYQYPFRVCSLFWDRVLNRLCAGTDDGSIVQLETGLSDQARYTTPGIAWSVTTREWSTPVDQILENLHTEFQGTTTWLADVDNTNTYTLGTGTAVVKGWLPASLQGSLGDNLNFIFQGTQSGTSQVITAIQWDAIPETPKVSFYATDPEACLSENYIKTWLPEINPLTGTTTGTLLIDGVVIMTASLINTNTGDVSRRQVFEFGLPNVTTGKNIQSKYSGGPFRYYDTKYEQEAKPFGKLTWLVTYKKAGGVTQADMARFYAMDIEGLSTHTITSTWIIDGSSFTTNTLTFGGSDSGEGAGVVRNYMDQVPFPPGARGYLFQQQCTSSSPFKVWRSSLDIDRIGIKGLSRVTLNGSPSAGSQ